MRHTFVNSKNFMKTWNKLFTKLHSKYHHRRREEKKTDDVKF